MPVARVTAAAPASAAGQAVEPDDERTDAERAPPHRATAQYAMRRLLAATTRRRAALPPRTPRQMMQPDARPMSRPSRRRAQPDARPAPHRRPPLLGTRSGEASLSPHAIAEHSVATCRRNIAAHGRRSDRSRLRPMSFACRRCAALTTRSAWSRQRSGHHTSTERRRTHTRAQEGFSPSSRADGCAASRRSMPSWCQAEPSRLTSMRAPVASRRPSSAFTTTSWRMPIPGDD